MMVQDICFPNTQQKQGVFAALFEKLSSFLELFALIATRI